MPLVQVASVGGGAVVLSADVDEAGVCLGAHLVTDRTVEVTLFRDGEDVATGTYGPGEHVKSLPKPRRFDWATSGIHAELAVRWP